MPRPEPLAVQNPQNMDVPAIQVDSSNLNMVAGRGFGGGLGEIGGGVMETIKITAFGFDKALEGTLQGTLYDFKVDNIGERTEYSALQLNESIGLIKPKILEFSADFDTWSFDKQFYKSSSSLYASYFIIPNQNAFAVPQAYGVEDEVKPTLIGVNYKGSFVAPKTGRFRLYGRADDVLIVRINRKIVLDASWDQDGYTDWERDERTLEHDEKNERLLFDIPQPGVSGDWFKMTRTLNRH